MIHRGTSPSTNLVDLTDHLGAAKRSALRNSKKEPNTSFSVFDTTDDTSKAVYLNGAKSL